MSKPNQTHKGPLDLQLVESSAPGQSHPLEKGAQEISLACKDLWSITNALVCTGSPAASLSFNKENNFRAINELG